MKVNILIQENNNNTLIEKIEKCFSNKPKKVYIISGEVKETGLKLIEEEMIDSKAKMFFALGIDKKNTVRSMLEMMLSYTNDVYIYSNNLDIEFEGSIIMFEYANEVVMYNFASGISEGSLRDNINVYLEILYDLTQKDQKDDYKELIKNIISKLQKDIFKKIEKSDIDELVESKEIFSTKQYSHTVKSISELLGKSNKPATTEDKVIDDDALVRDIPKVDLSDVDIDFDFSDVEDEIKIDDEPSSKNLTKEKSDDVEIDDEQIKQYDKDANKLLKDFEYNEDYIDKDNELYDESLENSEFDENDTLDIENLLFSKADVKLNMNKAKASKKDESKNLDDEDLVKVKKVNLNNVTNLIFELPSRPQKEQDTSVIKIPNYIKQMIPEFFGFGDDDCKNVKIGTSIYKTRDVNLEIIDAQENQKYNDREGKLMQKQGQTYLTFSTEKLKQINYEENDIARIIKLSDDTYHIEIISKKLQEYKLWSKICNQKFKSSQRKYGMM